eukprot:Skav203558  [mRNA]  locus=scaffold3576:122232:122666:+ [translate_table: standard]
MMRRLLTCPLLGCCLHLNGCGSGVKKCRCGRRLETGRMLSSRRRRTFVDSEYSEVCCHDWDPGATDTDTDDTYDDYWNSDEEQDTFDNALAAISRRRYVIRVMTESTMAESSTTESNTTESNTTESNTAEGNINITPATTWIAR